MKLSELLKIIENRVEDDATVIELIDGKKTEKKIDPEINIGFQLKGQGTEFCDFEIKYDEVFTRDQKEIMIVLKPQK